MKRAIFLIGLAAAAPLCASTPAQVIREPLYIAYPADAFAARQQGRVGVELRISASGTVEDCRVVQPVAESLDKASCAFWRRTLFNAAYDDRGRAVASTLRKFSDWRLPR
jgi:TonB family protein